MMNKAFRATLSLLLVCCLLLGLSANAIVLAASSNAVELNLQSTGKTGKLVLEEGANEFTLVAEKDGKMTIAVSRAGTRTKADSIAKFFGEGKTKLYVNGELVDGISTTIKVAKGDAITIVVDYAGNFKSSNDAWKNAIQFTVTYALNYVSFGASNTNGYGLSGYLPEGTTAENKADANVFGYQKMPVGSYPYLVAQALNEKLGGTFAEGTYTGDLQELQPFTNVFVNQLAMSSMRAEELRFLLDETYPGDNYTDWRFYDVNGDGDSPEGNWFGRANVDLDTLRGIYADAIANADVITFDMGVNNFGVFMNRAMSGSVSIDLNDIDPEIAAMYDEAKAYIRGILVEQAGEVALMMDEMNTVIDALAFTLVGFCTSFDVIMEKIYELNPDATVVVVSIQSLLTGLSLQIEGFDEELPLDQLFGAVINAANTYTAVVSPYSTKYQYADVRENGRVEFFVDQMLAYDGNPENLDSDIIDCFNVYDDDMHTERKVQQVFASQYGAALAANGYTMEQFLSEGKAGTLPEAFVPYYEMYVNARTVAYDVMGEVFQEALECHVLDFGALSFPLKGAIEGLLLSTFDQMALQAMGEVVADPTYQFDLDTLYPDGFYETMTEFVCTQYADVLAGAGVELTVDIMKTIACMGIRTGIGNSFFGHPNRAGHQQIADTILKAIDENIGGNQEFEDEVGDALRALYLYLEQNGYIDAAKADAKAYVENLMNVMGGIVDGNLNELIATLQGNITEMNAEVEALLAELETALNELAVLENETLVAMEEKLAELEAELAAMEAKLEAIQNGSFARSAVADGKEQAEALIEAIEETKAEIEELTAAIEYVKFQIAYDKSGIEAIQAAIAQLMANIEATEESLAVAVAAANKLAEDSIELYNACIVLNDALEVLYNDTVAQVDWEAVFEAIEVIIELTPVVIEEVQNVYNKTVEAIEMVEASVEVLENGIANIKGIAAALIASAEELAAIEAVKAEELLAAAEKIAAEINECVEVSFADVVEAMNTTAAELEVVLVAEYEKAMALYEENQTAIYAALAVAYWYADQKGYIDQANALVAGYVAMAGEYVETLKGELVKAEAYLNEVLPQIEAELLAKLAEAELAIQDAEAALAAAKAELLTAADKAAAEAAVEAAEAALAAAKALKAEVEAKIAEAKAVVEAIEAYINVVIADIEAVEAALNDVIDAGVVVYEDVLALIDALCNLKKAVCATVESAKDLAEAVCNEVVKLAGYVGLIIDETVDAVEAVVNAAEQTVETFTWLVENADDLAKELAELAVKYGEELAEELYNWAVENQEELKQLLIVLGEEALELLVELAKEYGVEILDRLVALVEEYGAEAIEYIKPYIEELLYNATHGDYVIDEDSSYVALGDGTYAGLVAEWLTGLVAEQAYYTYNTNDLTVAGSTIADLTAEQLAAAAAADLVTIGYGNETWVAEAITAVIDGMMYGTTVECDWEAVANSTITGYIEEALAEVNAMLLAEGLDAFVADMLTMAIELYAYRAAEYATELPEVIDAIHDENPDALIVVVGMANLFEGFTITHEGAVIDMGELVEYVVTAADVHGIITAIVNENVVYVPNNGVESTLTNTTLELMSAEAIGLLLRFEVEITEAGNAQILENIQNALNVTVINSGLPGDVNDDGVVDLKDLVRLRKYLAGADVVIHMGNADVNGDGLVDLKDLVRMRKYFAGADVELG